jgi:DNA-binding transcriptional MocR family regulator
MSLPPGGMNLWVELPDGLSSMALFEAALTRGVRIAPGAMFSNSMRFDRCIRINAGYLMDDAQREAVRTLGELCRQLQARSTGAVFPPQP